MDISNYVVAKENSDDIAIFADLEEDYGKDVAKSALRDSYRIKEFVMRVRLESQDPHLIAFVNILNLSDKVFPNYYVLSTKGRRPMLLVMLESLNKGLKAGMTLIRDDKGYQRYQGLRIEMLAGDYCSWHYPTMEKLEFIKRVVGERRVLEVGSGQGLLSALLDSVGIDVVTTDSGKWADDRNGKGFYFSNYQKLDNHAAIKKYANDPNDPEYCSVLLASWSIVELAWDEFSGDIAIIIGNTCSCGGYPDSSQWELVSSFTGEQWGIDKIDPDTINYYRRIPTNTSGRRRLVM